MKKILLAMFVLAVATVTAFIVFMSGGGRSVLTGYSLRCENGSYMIIEETGSPIRYSFNKAAGTNVEKLTDGDRILIVSDLINETYPGSTSAHFILKYAEGGIEDVPEETLERLIEMGWYKIQE